MMIVVKNRWKKLVNDRRNACLIGSVVANSIDNGDVTMLFAVSTYRRLHMVEHSCDEEWMVTRRKIVEDA